ncbi:hypothetical protein OSB04_010083 [Centaurea solstitialis]|uniref:F-box domain-containing protein n=1 Tax=Centaurea solstitialis TaxID=347529 RepID=A0AA38WMS2_9ASTR|nr:hypothetical protein OSB04_010083 [Centaurea solstitialis]
MLTGTVESTKPWRNGKKIKPPHLSAEILLFHILPKLPGKSLLRFKCVCKQWRSFLATPLFANIHLHHVTTVDRSRHEKVFFLHKVYTSKSRNYCETVDCEDGSIAKPCCYPFRGYAMILGSSVNGLLCVGIERRSTSELTDIILWNPLTGEYKKLSKPIDAYRYDEFELFYNCSDDDYKILSITIFGIVYMYSLKSDSWRKLESTVDHHGDHIPYAAASDHNLLDGKLHFLTGPGKEGFVIIRLDLKTEKFTKIRIPRSCRGGSSTLMVVRGCIELTTFKAVSHSWLSRRWTIEMWRMNGYGDWTNMVNISYTHDDGIRPLRLMRNGNLIMLTKKDDSSEICKVDPEKKTVDVFCSRPEMVFIKIYIETFVSPNQYGVS